MINPEQAELPDLIDAWVRMQHQAQADAEHADAVAIQARQSADQAKTLHSAIRTRMRKLGVQACTHNHRVYQLDKGQLHATSAPDARYLEHPGELPLGEESVA